MSWLLCFWYKSPCELNSNKMILVNSTCFNNYYVYYMVQSIHIYIYIIYSVEIELDWINEWITSIWIQCIYQNIYAYNRKVLEWRRQQPQQWRIYSSIIICLCSHHERNSPTGIVMNNGNHNVHSAYPFGPYFILW